jgi:hypothetical protein
MLAGRARGWHLLNCHEGSEKRDLKVYWGITFPITYSGCVSGNFFRPAVASVNAAVHGISLFQKNYGLPGPTRAIKRLRRPSSCAGDVQQFDFIESTLLGRNFPNLL